MFTRNGLLIPFRPTLCRTPHGEVYASRGLGIFLGHVPKNSVIRFEKPSRFPSLRLSVIFAPQYHFFSKILLKFILIEVLADRGTSPLFREEISVSLPPALLDIPEVRIF